MNVTRSLTADTYLVTHGVGAGQQGIRLDAFLKGRYARRSREQLKRAIASGAVTLKRAAGTEAHAPIGRLKPSSQLVAGDEVLVLTERRPEPEVSFDYRVLHEDELLYIIDKPAHLPVHPSGRYFFNTLLVHLKTRGHRDPLRAERDFYLVHRIDKETSGVLVLARDREICAGLTRQFAQRLTRKRYLAIVHGAPPEHFESRAALKRDPHSLIGVKMAPMPESAGGLPSHTEFRRLETAGPFSLIECHPRTGRQHQIRAHLDHLGFPIVGDKLYGMPEREALDYYERKHLSAEAQARLLMPRHALHAASIEFTHPRTGAPLRFEAPLPEDMRSFLEKAARAGASAPLNLALRYRPARHSDPEIGT